MQKGERLISRRERGLRHRARKKYTGWRRPALPNTIPHPAATPESLWRRRHPARGAASRGWVPPPVDGGRTRDRTARCPVPRGSGDDEHQVLARARKRLAQAVRCSAAGKASCRPPPTNPPSLTSTRTQPMELELSERVKIKLLISSNDERERVQTWL